MTTKTIQRAAPAAGYLCAWRRHSVWNINQWMRTNPYQEDEKQVEEWIETLPTQSDPLSGTLTCISATAPQMHMHMHSVTFGHCIRFERFSIHFLRSYPFSLFAYVQRKNIDHCTKSGSNKFYSELKRGRSQLYSDLHKHPLEAKWAQFERPINS